MVRPLIKTMSSKSSLDLIWTLVRSVPVWNQNQWGFCPASFYFCNKSEDRRKVSTCVLKDWIQKTLWMFSSFFNLVLDLLDCSEKTKARVSPDVNSQDSGFSLGALNLQWGTSWALTTWKWLFSLSYMCKNLFFP